MPTDRRSNSAPQGPPRWAKWGEVVLKRLENDIVLALTRVTTHSPPQVYACSRGSEKLRQVQTIDFQFSAFWDKTFCGGCNVGREGSKNK